jgi:hypothetical protein
VTGRRFYVSQWPVGLHDDDALNVSRRSTARTSPRLRNAPMGFCADSHRQRGPTDPRSSGTPHEKHLTPIPTGVRGFVTGLQRQSSRAAGSPRQVRGLVPAPRRAAATSKIGSARAIPALITFDNDPRSLRAPRQRPRAPGGDRRHRPRCLRSVPRSPLRQAGLVRIFPRIAGIEAAGSGGGVPGPNYGPQTVRFHYSVRRRSVRTRHQSR